MRATKIINWERHPVQESVKRAEKVTVSDSIFRFDI